MTGYTRDWYGKKFHNIESSVAPMMGEVDLLKVSHHGADTATNEDWCDTLKPTVAVITCGQGSDLPDKESIQNLQAVKTKVYTTGTKCHQENIKAVGGVTQMGEDIIVSYTKGRSTFKVTTPSGKNTKTYKVKQNKPESRTCELLEA